MGLTTTTSPTAFMVAGVQTITWRHSTAIIRAFTKTTSPITPLGRRRRPRTRSPQSRRVVGPAAKVMRAVAEAKAVVEVVPVAEAEAVAVAEAGVTAAEAVRPLGSVIARGRARPRSRTATSDRDDVLWHGQWQHSLASHVRKVGNS